MTSGTTSAKKPVDWPLAKKIIGMLTYLLISYSCDGDREGMSAWSDLLAAHLTDVLKRDVAVAQKNFRFIRNRQPDAYLKMLEAVEQALPQAFAAARQMVAEKMNVRSAAARARRRRPRPEYMRPVPTPPKDP